MVLYCVECGTPLSPTVRIPFERVQARYNPHPPLEARRNSHKVRTTDRRNTDWENERYSTNGGRLATAASSKRRRLSGSSHLIRLLSCPCCARTVDAYVERDSTLVFIDLVLHRHRVFRHLLLNGTSGRGEGSMGFGRNDEWQESGSYRSAVGNDFDTIDKVVRDRRFLNTWRLFAVYVALECIFKWSQVVSVVQDGQRRAIESNLGCELSSSFELRSTSISGQGGRRGSGRAEESRSPLPSLFPSGTFIFNEKKSAYLVEEASQAVVPSIASALSHGSSPPTTSSPYLTHQHVVPAASSDAVDRSWLLLCSSFAENTAFVLGIVGPMWLLLRYYGCSTKKDKVRRKLPKGADRHDDAQPLSTDRTSISLLCSTVMLGSFAKVRFRDYCSLGENPNCFHLTLYRDRTAFIHLRNHPTRILLVNIMSTGLFDFAPHLVVPTVRVRHD